MGHAQGSRGYLKPLIVAHKQLIRLIRNVPARAHTKLHHDRADILNIPNLYVLRVCAEMHPYIHTASAKERQEPAQSRLQAAAHPPLRPNHRGAPA